jgi:capsular polysaccharide biosynthesis protein
MADEEQEPVVEEPVKVVGVAKAESPRRTNKAVIGLAIGLVILCAIIVYVVFFDKKKGARNNYNNRSKLPILNSRTISDNSGYGGSFNTNSARNFRV